MRVRPLRPTDRRNQSRTERRPHVFGRTAEQEQEAQEIPQAEVVDAHPAERRHRESVASEDTAYYACACGFQFQAPVTTSVACPHCGSAQAW